ncbi:hypothetical protein F4604DRAFT_1903922 [Suillus subluteus]|nr:hypothetical protein F4604DRAFT_1903922 [Suillus subluteus]
MIKRVFCCWLVLSLLIYEDPRSKGLGIARLGYADTIIFRPGLFKEAQRADKRLAETILGYVTGAASHFTSNVEIHVSVLAKAIYYESGSVVGRSLSFCQPVWQNRFCPADGRTLLAESGRMSDYRGSQRKLVLPRQSFATVSANRHPLKALAITLLSIVPLAADVERLFSDLGSTQSPKRCNLTVDTLIFEALAKIRANLRYHSHQKALANGRPIRRRHAHMYTSARPGINVDVAADLEANFAWAPPLAPQTQEHR